MAPTRQRAQNGVTSNTARRSRKQHNHPMISLFSEMGFIALLIPDFEVKFTNQSETGFTISIPEMGLTTPHHEIEAAFSNFHTQILILDLIIDP